MSNHFLNLHGDYSAEVLSYYSELNLNQDKATSRRQYR